jgi:hypothetical protein
MKTYLECLSRAAEVTDQVALSANIKLTLSDDELILLQQAAEIYAKQSNSHKPVFMQAEASASAEGAAVGNSAAGKGVSGGLFQVCPVCNGKYEHHYSCDLNQESA